MQGICKLCGQQKTLRYSHIVPAFAVRWLKKTSLTGYLKTLKSKVRVQETRRVFLPCGDCEQILGRDEKIFCEQLFIPLHEKNQQQFEYGSWLRRFIVGLHWKVLVTKEETYPAKAEAAYAKAEAEWRQFLLGQSASPGDAEFHLFLSDVVQDSTGGLPQKINWYLLISTSEFLMSISKCIVRLKDCHNTEHSVEVYAESLYEAVLKGLSRLEVVGWESESMIQLLSWGPSSVGRPR